MEFKERFVNCYWCGEKATGKDHVPPLNLFPIEKRVNLIKVGSCKKHNEEFSKLDERMRFHMVLLGDEKIARELYENKVVGGLKRAEGIGLTIDLSLNYFEDLKGKQWQRDETESFTLYFEKILRGLFYYHYGKHINGSTSHFSNKMQHVTMSANAHFYYHLLEDDMNELWIEGKPKNQEIFDYKYYYAESDGRFFVIMTFYREHKVIGLTIPIGKTIDNYGLDFEDYLQRIKQ